MTAEPRLRVMQVTKRYPGAVGGDATAVASLERTLTQRGHHVTIVTTRCSAITSGPNIHQLGLPISDAALDRAGPRRFLSCLWMALWGLWLLRRERPDVLHAHAPEVGVALALPARLLGVPRVITLHGTSIGNLRFRRKSWLERYLVRAGDYHRLFTVDPHVLPMLHGLGRTPAVFMPNGVALEDYPTWRGPRQDARLLFVGRLEAVKSVDVLLKALAVAHAQGSDAALDIVGAGRLGPELRRLTSRLGLDEKVSFLGACSHEQVAQRMAEAAALVLPSSYEGFPIVLLEAWAVGLPVIVTSVGAVPHVCLDGEDAMVVAPQDPLAFARAIVKVLGDQRVAVRLATSGRHKVQRYSQDVISSRVLDEYRAVVLSSRR